MMNNSLKTNYQPYQNITIDEQLFPFRGRCSFKQYIPSKPAKYGIKVFWAADAATHYPLRGEIYYGSEDGVRNVGVGERTVLKLVKDYEKSSRCITTDNFSTSLPLARALLSRRLGLICTLRANKKCMPRQMVVKKGDPKRRIGTKMFAYSDDVTMVAYTAKKDKTVYMLSTFEHYDGKVDPVSGKPEMILDYNTNKGGVDTMDQMVTTLMSLLLILF